GTHTAGIAAGVTGKTAVVNGVSIDDMSGIAPGAWLGTTTSSPITLMRAVTVHAARTSSTRSTRQSRTEWIFSIFRWEGATMVTTTYWRLGSITRSMQESW